jgi:hypothetical protein
MTAVAVPVSGFIRRPRLWLEEDVEREYSHVAAGVEPRYRLLVKSSRWRRAAYQTRVEVLGYRRATHPDWTWLGNLPLSWRGSDERAAAVYAGATRPVELGALLWHVPVGWKPSPSMYSPSPEAADEQDAASLWFFISRSPMVAWNSNRHLG